MELSVAQVADQAGRGERLVQKALAAGALMGHRRYGRVTVIDDLAATAWVRGLSRGRPWTAETCDAAFDLLSHGHTAHLAGSELSRLRSRLRTMTAAQIAHAAGGLGPWARYRGAVTATMRRAGPSAVDHSSLGIVGEDDWLTFIEVTDLDDFELATDVVLDADGNLGVVERRKPDGRIARVLLDAYLLGDARLSHAAAAELGRRAKRA